ncbi:Hypothetical_protein [Hexamita inflata]|uniref:Hypothetical_protein n=1 Tax=Hexamita inflata TaxID=28002 RepID=A0AA86Q395_9EUKA|nr:Hypothetical protein HINF_LOCUS37406 [Hexamita inflata]
MYVVNRSERNLTTQVGYCSRSNIVSSNDGVSLSHVRKNNSYEPRQLYVTLCEADVKEAISLIIYWVVQQSTVYGMRMTKIHSSKALCTLITVERTSLVSDTSFNTQNCVQSYNLKQLGRERFNSWFHRRDNRQCGYISVLGSHPKPSMKVCGLEYQYRNVSHYNKFIKLHFRILEYHEPIQTCVVQILYFVSKTIYLVVSREAPLIQKTKAVFTLSINQITLNFKDNSRVSKLLHW